MKELDREILELFGEAYHARGHLCSAPGRKMGPRSFDFGELSTDRLQRTTKAERRAEAREFKRYYMRKWWAAVKADPAKRERYRAMACAYVRKARRKAWPQIKADPKRIAKIRATQRAFYERHRESISERRRAKYDPAAIRREYEALLADPEKRARRQELVRVRGKRYRAKLKADPERVAKYRAVTNRNYHRKAMADGRPQGRCGACRQYGHNRRTCGQ
jgi:hypothetical protein